MRTTWKTIRNETKRGDSVELSRFFLPQFFSQNIVLNNAKKNGPRIHTDKKKLK